MGRKERVIGRCWRKGRGGKERLSRDRKNVGGREGYRDRREVERVREERQKGAEEKDILNGSCVGDGREGEIDGEGRTERNNKREVGEGESEGEGQEGIGAKEGKRQGSRRVGGM